MRIASGGRPRPGVPALHRAWRHLRAPFEAASFIDDLPLDRRMDEKMKQLIVGPAGDLHHRLQVQAHHLPAAGRDGVNRGVRIGADTPDDVEHLSREGVPIGRGPDIVDWRAAGSREHMDRGRAELDPAARHTKVVAEANKHAARTKDRTLQDSGARNRGEDMDLVEGDSEVAMVVVERLGQHLRCGAKRGEQDVRHARELTRAHIGCAIYLDTRLPSDPRRSLTPSHNRATAFRLSSSLCLSS